MQQSQITLNRRHNLSEHQKQVPKLPRDILHTPPKQQLNDSYRRTHAKTFHVCRLNPESIDSNESDHDTLYQQSQRRATQLLPKPKFKAVQQFSYITQKMMPDYERNLKTISVIESRAYQVNFTNNYNNKKETYLNDGEILINYSTDKLPIELNQEYVNVQKIRQLEFYYYKIKCFGEQCPISFQMVQTEQTKFKMFLSTTNPFPSKFSCEQIYQVKVWKYKGKHHKYFKQNYIFLSLVCDLDTTIKLSFNFGAKTCVQIAKSPVKVEQAVFSCTLTAEQIIQKRRQRTLSLAKGRNLVQENIMNVTFQNDECFKSIKQKYRTIQQQKSQDIQQKKKQLDFQRQGEKEINYFQKEFTFFIKKMKQKQFLQNGNFKNETIFQWIRILTFINFIEIINERMKNQQKLIHHVHIIQIKMKTIYFRAKKNICRLKGPRIHGRVHLDVRFCLVMFCKQIQQKVRGENLQIILPHFRYRALLWNFREYMNSTSRHLQFIRDNIYNFVIRVRMYKSFLKLLFEKHFDEYFSLYYFQQDEKMKKLLEIWYNNSKYTLYFQLISKIFSNLYVQQNMKKYLKKIKLIKQQNRQKVNVNSHRSQNENKINIHFINFFRIPLQKDYNDIMLQVYNQTKEFSEQLGKEQIRKGYQKLKL